MGDKKVHIELTPRKSHFTGLAAWVDGQLANQSQGAPIRVTVEAAKTVVRIQCSGDPRAEFHFLLAATYATGRYLVIFDRVIALDQSGSHTSNYQVPSADPTPTPTLAV